MFPFARSFSNFSFNLILVSRRGMASSKPLGRKVFIVSAARTPIGAFMGSLKDVPATRLGSIAITGALERSGWKSGVEIDEVIFGQVCQAGVGQAPARQAALGAGLPDSTPCTTINKVCASGMKSIMMGAASIASGQTDLVVAGGMESMSNVPFYQKRQMPAYGGFTMIDGIVNDGLTDAYDSIHMGQCAEKTNSQLKISKDEQDEFAKNSYTKAQAASSALEREIVQVEIPGFRGKPSTFVTADEEPPKANFDKGFKLKPAFVKETGTITAFNASKLNDGAAACVLASSEGLKKLAGCQPLAEIISFADAALAPVDFSIAPSKAIPKAMANAGIECNDEIDWWETNEAFSSVVLANCQLTNVPLTKVNLHGGAVSLGHPIGASGARITNVLATHLKAGQTGLASICNGGGGASAIVVRKL